MVSVFLLRTDSVNGKKEGEEYQVTKGITLCDFWSSPKLIDHKVIIASGIENIKQVYVDYSDYRITEK